MVPIMMTIMTIMTKIKMMMLMRMWANGAWKFWEISLITRLLIWRFFNHVLTCHGGDDGFLQYDDDPDDHDGDDDMTIMITIMMMMTMVV